MTTVRRTMLVLVSADQNSNKFYEVTLDGSGVVTKRWGRVGATGQKKVEASGTDGYYRAIEAKRSRGYTEVDLVDSDTASTAPGVADLAAVAKKRIPTDPSDAELGQIITAWCAANRHNIEAKSGGHIKVSEAGVVSTALGVVSLSTVCQARQLLNEIAAGTGVPTKLIESYLTLIPQSVGGRHGWHEKFIEPDEVTRQREFLDSLDASLALASTAADDSGDSQDAEFRYQLTKIGSRTKKFKEIAARYDRSKNGRHTSAGMKLAAVYAISPTRPAEADTWASLADKYGNVRRLWHGTSEHNLISILHRGLIVAPSGGTFTRTGRMFGDGVYFSDQSTKSLNYSHGFWSGGARASRCFMFLADVVMGHELRPTDRMSLTTQTRSGKYQSIHVKGGTCGVLNNEMIVWDTDQIRLSYVCEFRA